jgi:hypothetical protein
MLELITNESEGTAKEVTQSLDELARDGARRIAAPSGSLNRMSSDALAKALLTRLFGASNGSENHSMEPYPLRY